jgi:hypothetical protein
MVWEHPTTIRTGFLQYLQAIANQNSTEDEGMDASFQILSDSLFTIIHTFDAI